VNLQLPAAVLCVALGLCVGGLARREGSQAVLVFTMGAVYGVLLMFLLGGGK
jgi:uncharacterized protein involved in response to NO